MGNKEVRDILLGRVVRQDERFWAAAPSDVKFRFQGLKDGAGDVRLFGVTHLARQYQAAEMEPEIVFAAAGAALDSMGTPLHLASLPEAKACLYAPNWIAPVLLTVEQASGLQITAYTGRSPLVGRFRCRIALWLLERRLPEEIACVGKSRKPSRTETKNTEKKKPEQKTEKKRPVKKETKSAPKRVASPQKKKAAPKRLKK